MTQLGIGGVSTSGPAADVSTPTFLLLDTCPASGLQRASDERVRMSPSASAEDALHHLWGRVERRRVGSRRTGFRQRTCDAGWVPGREYRRDARATTAGGCERTLQSTVFSHYAPTIRCVRVTALVPGNGIVDSVVSKGVMVQFLPEEELPDSVRVVVNIPNSP